MEKDSYTFDADEFKREAIHLSLTYMNTEDLIAQLMNFGLTATEARLYCYLQTVKSASIRDIRMAQPTFSKQHMNVYSVINNLLEKHYIISEIRNRQTLFIPIQPAVILHEWLARKQQELDHLQQFTPSIIKALEDLRISPISQHSFPNEAIKGLILQVIKPHWALINSVDLIPVGDVGHLYLYEFETQRRLLVSIASVGVHMFESQEIRNSAFHNVRDYQRFQIEERLNTYKTRNTVPITHYTFRNIPAIIRGLKTTIPMTEILVRINKPGIYKGGFCSICLSAFPKSVITIWGSNIMDFRIIVQNLTELYAIDNVDSE